ARLAHRDRPLRRLRARHRRLQILRAHPRCSGGPGAGAYETKGNCMTKVAINGFGRIGRLVARAILERPDCGLELVSVNDLADAKANAWLFKRDSVHGKFPGEVKAEGDAIVVNGKRIQVTAEKDPAKLPHAANGVDIALECTGFFADREGAQKHIDAGAK